MVFYGFYLKKQMVLAESPSYSKQARRARQFIEHLTEIARGNYLKVWQASQLLLFLGLIIVIVGMLLLIPIHQ